MITANYDDKRSQRHPMKNILLTLALAGFASASSAQQLGGSDLGQTAPTPGAADVSQLLTTGDTEPLPDGSFNYFYDNTSPPVGSSFTTGANAGGYTMTSLAIKFGGTAAGGYAGGADTTLNPGWTITLYSLSGTGNTTATAIYTNTVGTLAGTGNTGGDWIQITGFNQHLLPGSVYAWTISSSGYDDLAWATNKPYTGGSICQIPAGGGTVTYAADNASAAFDVGLATGPILLGGADLGQTAPTPGASDAAQLLTTGDTVQLQDGGSLNYFYDNTANSAGYVGSSFTTGANPGGYTMASLALKFGGGQPVGYAGGADTTLNPGWIITIYKLSGTGNTTATGIYTNTVGTLAGTVNTGGDWIKITGFAQALQANSVYAWTIFSSGYDDLAYATGKPYAGGTICQIPPAGGTVTYATDNDSATFDVGLTPIELPLVVVNLGAGVNPTPGPNDISQLQYSGVSDNTSGINYYDNDSGSSSPGASGQSFTTGSNPGGYVMTSLAVKFNGTSYGGADAAGSQSWRIVVFQLSGTSNATATPIITNTSQTITTSSDAPGNTSDDWLAFTGMYVPLLSNTVYAYTIDTSSSPSYTGYDDLGDANVTPYTNGLICRIMDGGGAVTYYPSDPNTASFDISLSLQGYPSVGIGLASPNPCYALSPVALSETAGGPGTLTYQWQTNSDLSGGLGGTWANVPNATNLTLSFTPPNADSGTLDFQFIVHNAAGFATSAPIALVVNPSQAPASSTGVVPANITTYAGATVSFTDASFVGTTPITYQWQVNTGSGYQNISSAVNPSATNTTLNLTNVPSAAAGSYQLVASNSQGSANDSFGGSGVGTLTLLTTPTLPVSTTPQNVPYLEYSNGPYAYWRLQETGNPASAPPPVIAYDYSGNGFDATYGTGVTTSNAGPQAPFFSGFSSNELAAGTSFLAGGYLTVPPLSLKTNTVSFVAWINPNQNPNNATGLFFDRPANDASGFGFNANPNASGMPCLGLTWNSNSATTYGWNSGLYPKVGLWSFVAYVVSPAGATAYLFYVDTTVTPYTTNYFQSTLSFTPEVETFSTSSFLGADTQQTGQRTFSGSMAEAAIYTNALSGSQVLSIFLASIGSAGAPVSPPLILPSPSIFMGESIQLNGTAGGTPPITYQWMSSPDGVTWTPVPANANYSGVTSATLQINNATLADALEYEVVAKNPISTNTSGVATVTVTAVPTGLWTMNFQVTNTTLGFATSATGGGQYDGHGVLGTGTYWNCFVNNAGAFAYGTFSTASDFLDDGVTHAGIYASVNGDNDSTLASPAGAGSISTLLDQFVYNATALTFTGVPDGTYSLIIYGIDGGFANGSESFIVNDTNSQSASFVNDQAAYFSQGGNSALFTNVGVSGGTLLVNVGGSGGEYNANINGAQLQLISYATTVTNIPLTYSVTGNALTLSWAEGILQTATNLLGPWVDIADPSPVTVSTTNKVQFFRIAGPAQ